MPGEPLELDKPIVIGEFWRSDQASDERSLHEAYDNGYAGAWAWQYANADTSDVNAPATRWPAMKAPMARLYARNGSALDCAE